MNQKLLGSLTATLLLTTLGASFTGSAHSTETGSQPPEASVDATPQESLPLSLNLSTEVVKVGEQQTPAIAANAEVVAKIHSHPFRGRKAATLYVKNIPVMVFVGTSKGAPDGVKMGVQSSPSRPQTSVSTAANKSLDTDGDQKAPDLGTSENLPQAHPLKEFSRLTPPNDPSDADPNDPVWRASEVAARLNQMNRQGMDAGKISVSLDRTASQSFTKGDRYLIKLNNELLVAIDADTFSSDTTRNLEQDALQVTNRLRRLLGNAAPLTEIVGKAGTGRAIALGPIKLPVDGWASWYGPGFDGNRSASGEVFRQNALTAAHRTLPFGTQVLVTNLDNGVSVVVRINDRGPFHGNRIIDLSTAAARVLGLIQSGVAPVRLDIVPAAAATGGI